jgi:hypothetical protein
MKLREQLGIEFLKEIDVNLRYFCKKIRETLRDERDCVIAITGYPGVGKSNDAAIIGCIIDYDYTFEKNVCFIPTSEQIGEKYMSLNMFSILHIDEASRGLDKKRWYEKIQQKLNELYDTEREGHFLCTLLLMPRFQNFTENFRNFRIKYWINIIERGYCVVYRRDEDPHVKDPWHMDENYKLKEKRWRGKKILERDIASTIKMEQVSKNYWFWFRVPKIPDGIWKDYQKLKKDSRNMKVVENKETAREKAYQQRKITLIKVQELIRQGYTKPQMAVLMKMSLDNLTHHYKEAEAMSKVGEESNILLNHNKENKFNKIQRDMEQSAQSSTKL